MVKQHSVDGQRGVDVYDLDDDEEPELLARLTEHDNLCLHAFEVKLARIRRIVPHPFLSLIRIRNEERPCVAIADNRYLKALPSDEKMKELEKVGYPSPAQWWLGAPS